MDATRARRTRDQIRQRWYALHRQQRFARFLGFGSDAQATSRASLGRDVCRIASGVSGCPRQPPTRRECFV